VLPSMFVLLTLSVVYVRFGSLPWIAAMFNGLKPVVIALVMVALQRIAKRALRGPVQGAIAVSAFTAMFFLMSRCSWSCLAPLLWESPWGRCGLACSTTPEKTAAENDEESYYIHRGSVAPDTYPCSKACCEGGYEALFL